MTRDSYEVLMEHLRLPEKFLVYEETKGVKKSRMVETDRNHFIRWIEKRTSFYSIYDWTLRMIESEFKTILKSRK